LRLLGALLLLVLVLLRLLGALLLLLVLVLLRLLGALLLPLVLVLLLFTFVLLLVLVLLFLIFVLLLLVFVLLLVCVDRSSDSEKQEQNSCADKSDLFHKGTSLTACFVLIALLHGLAPSTRSASSREEPSTVGAFANTFPSISDRSSQGQRNPPTR
jgi:hypothetical protein